MISKNERLKILISAGGTGGHLFPAVAIAEEIKEQFHNAEIFFIGTKKRMEAEILPKLGYKYSGTSVIGLPRKLSIKFLIFLISFLLAFIQSLLKLISFRPKVSIGTGSYISVPPLLAARLLGSKIFLVESNSLPGVATKFLAPLASEIYLSFEKTKEYFKKDYNFVVTGTPVRNNLYLKNREAAAKYFGLSPDVKTILVLGGSLGAKSLNEKIFQIYLRLAKNYQLIWQTGKTHYQQYKDLPRSERVVILPFIERMDYAYSICDLLISRAGASTISEIVSQGIPAILIPSPNVTENHQYFNARTLFEKDAAEILFDAEAADDLYNKIISFLEDEARLKKLSENAKSLFQADASKVIVERIRKIILGNGKKII